MGMGENIAIMIVALAIIGICFYFGYQLFSSFYDTSKLSIDVDTGAIDQLGEDASDLGGEVFQNWDFDAFNAMIMFPLAIVIMVFFALLIFHKITSSPNHYSGYKGQ